MNPQLERPEVGTKIAYTYGSKQGIIEIAKKTQDRVWFFDHFNGRERYESMVNFRWTTWDLHITSTVTPIGIINAIPAWEV